MKQFAQKSVATAGLIYKSSRLSVDDVDEPSGVISAYVNSMETVDLQKDVIHKGAWAGVINEMRAGRQKWPSLLLGHNWEKGVGVVSDAYEAGDKLQITGRFNMRTQAGRDAFENVRAGVYKDYSVGFQPGDHEYDSHGVNHIRTITLWPETSIVLVGASPGTGTLLAKGAPLPDYLRYKSRPSWMQDDVDIDRVVALVQQRLSGQQSDERPFLAPEPYRDPDAPRAPFNALHDVIADLYDNPVDPDGLQGFLGRVTAGEIRRAEPRR